MVERVCASIRFLFHMLFFDLPETNRRLYAPLLETESERKDCRLIAESEDFVLNEKGSLCLCFEEIADGFELADASSTLVSSPDHCLCC